ncbi:hypothetical protein [Actinoplanes utahensis]|uniref:Lipoprotein n=1 Tax=Actinoplanes utahensis TaxID=1869 RepID=A0A0A6UI47_ACTUT|nr:hypothetical protein [Actinoplanes utahensis]KHD75121.1 hypothetical protein MB27_24680 [Actinoplanes utahensis]GIF27061.1 hypothetical protein Aut01nite_00470 [Actinoplanes utahensis]
MKTFLRYGLAAATLLATSAGAFALSKSDAAPVDLRTQIETRMRTVLEQADPGQHQHAGHAVQPSAGAARPAVVCGVRVYGHEPAAATALDEVRTVYGFHLCGVAEQQRPWDVAVKLAGPLILDMTTDPPGIEVVEATAEVKYVDRVWQRFPPRYAEVALAEALSAEQMADLRERYDDAAGL